MMRQSQRPQTDAYSAAAHGKRLSVEEIAGYRRRLETLAAVLHAPGKTYSVPQEIWNIYNPGQEPGRQIYESFSDDELLDMVLRVYPNPQKRPRFSELHTVYRIYIKKRFGSEGKATGMAQKRSKQLRNQARWPITWPAALTLEPIQDALKRKKLPFDPNVKALLERLIRESQATGVLPQLSEGDKLAIVSLGLGRYREVMQLAGFPMLEAKQMKPLEDYWAMQRKTAVI